jgi:acetyl esterase/lipase
MTSLLVLTLLWLGITLIPWLPQPTIWLWKASVILTALGHWLALITLIFMALLIFFSKPWLRQRSRWWAALGALALSAALLVSPLQSVLEHQDQWQKELTKAFGSRAQTTTSWIQWRRLWLGDSETEAPPQSFEYVRYGDTPLLLDFYKPQAASHAPWVLVIHGGGWSSGDAKQLPELNWHLAQNGYGVVAISYRLAPRWQWPAQEQDALAAIEFVKHHATEWGLDPNRWVALGRSAGGQIAGSVAYGAHASGLISIYSPTDLFFGYEAGDEDDALGSRQLLRDYLGGTPYDQEAKYNDASVIHRISTQSCPTLILHGRGDSLVWYKHSERLYNRLIKAKVPAALIELPHGPHGYDYFFSSPEAQVATAAIDQFLKSLF